MKTINLKLSKRIAPYLENVETEYGYAENKLGDMFIRIDHTLEGPILYKTLTLEEAIDFILKKNIHILLQYDYDNNIYCLVYYNGSAYFMGDSQIICIEKMLEYLLDNNLLGK